MARPKKEGLDYFPLDVDIFENEKIEAISGEFGLKGELAVVKLLCAVYKNGYFVVWNDLLKMTLLKRLPGVSEDLIQQIVERLVKWNLFDKDLFDSSQVLTSRHIQETYLEATKRRKMLPKLKYSLVNVDINPTSMVVNVDINPQSKVKETKVNKNKVNKNIKGPSAPADAPNPFAYYQQAFGVLNAIRQEDIAMWVQDIGVELVIEAMKRASLAQKNYPYAVAIMKGWVNTGIKSLEDVTAADLAFQRKVQTRTKKPTRVEKVPDWLDPNYQPKTKQISTEEQAKLNEQIARLKAGDSNVQTHV